MSHEIRYVDYHCSKSESAILKDINKWAYDPLEASGYHGRLNFHKDIVCKNRDEAFKKLEPLCKRAYDDHAVFYKDGRKKFWLAKVEWHC